MRKLGVAIVGVGFWGRNHARVYKEMPEVELVAVCDIDLKRTESIAKTFDVEGYVDSREMLKRDDVEAVSICTWSTNLAVEALKALNAGKHVLVEKPMASDVRQAKELINTAEEEGLILMAGFIERFNPGVQRVKDLINKGELGTIVSATARRVSQWPERIGDVGVIKDTAIHDIDIIRHVFSDDPIVVYAKVGRLKHIRFEDYAQIMLTFKGGRTAFIEANWLTPYKVRNLLVTGSDAIASLNYLTQEVKVERAGQCVMLEHEWKEPLKLELQHFVGCVLNNKEPLVTGADGLKALLIAEASLKSSMKCRAVKLKAFNR